MTASPQDVQAKLLKTTSSGAQMVKMHGPDPSKWPAGNWTSALTELAQLVSPPPAAFPTPPGPMVDSPTIVATSAGDVTTTGKRVTTVRPDYIDGIYNMCWPPVPSSGTWTLTDCEADNQLASPPGSKDGQNEAGFWIGQRTTAARLVATNNYIGMWAGAMCDGSDISDFNLYGNLDVALYCEHIARRSTFRRFKIDHTGGLNAAVVLEEWRTDTTYGPMLPYGGKAGPYSLTFDGFDIYVPAGVWAFDIEPGAFDIQIRNGKIHGPGNGIRYSSNTVDATRPNVFDLATVDMTELAGTHILDTKNPIGA